ncbi:GGDEF domain-containing protein [Roseateles sp.]|uniref:GGDEF domain-containing protein n=1 Tax=Roseateles sp. TaxID=1971397 RepID=UPI003266A5DC
MGLRWRSEYLLLLLVLLSLAAVQFSDLLLGRTRVIVPGEHVHVKLASDQLNGGNSEIAQGPGPGLNVACTLRERYAYPYCAIALEFDQKRLKGLDLSEVQRLRLWVDYQGPGTTLRMLLRNANPAYGIAPTAAEATKYNQIEINATSIVNGSVELDLANFVVANWWMAQFHIPAHLSRPEFTNVVALEVSTGTDAPPGNYRFVLRKIELETQWLSTERWYLGIISLWLGLALLYLLLRVVHLQRRGRQLARMVNTDALTGALNRKGLEGALQRALADWREHRHAIGLVLIDIDHFKAVNDSHGHQAGDRVLAGLAELVRSRVRGQDLLGRWGGEEFLLICRDTTLTQAVAIAEKLRALVAAHDFGGLHITASFGVAAMDDSERPPDQFFAAADAALYRAKGQGRNRVVGEGA